MTRNELHRILRTIAPGIKAAIDTAVAAKVATVDARREEEHKQGRMAFDALMARLVALEARPVGVKYCGVWTPEQAYRVHDAVSHHGSLWIAKTNQAGSEPGADPIAWQLAVKKGRDGKDVSR
jgi:hypothetical protein